MSAVCVSGAGGAGSVCALSGSGVALRVTLAAPRLPERFDLALDHDDGIETPLLTGLAGTCPLYSILGIRTCKLKN